MQILVHSDIIPGNLQKQYDRTLSLLADGNFSAVSVKKMIRN